MKTIMTREITETCPEKMRVVSVCNWFLVQSFSPIESKWVTQAEWRNEKEAIMDMVNWY